MKFISTKVHGIIDYLTAFLLIGLPFTLHYNTGTMEGRIFIILGVVLVIYSLITRYEHGLVDIIPFKLHLIFDLLSGILLAASPWIFGFYHEAYLPHLIIGLFEIFVTLFTKTRTSLAD
jgi:hypothetical protein